MKKFYTIIPQQQELTAYRYTAVGNARLQMDRKSCFPILAALEGYVRPGEEVAVIAVVPDLDNCRQHLEAFRRELEESCGKKQVPCPEVRVVTVPNDEHVAVHVETFQKLLDFAADDDELFCCMTYGTKPLSTALMMAVQYAYRVKKNTTISCIVYGHVFRPTNDKSTWTGSVYDMTALVQMDEIVRVLADRGVENPKAVIDQLLAL